MVFRNFLRTSSGPAPAAPHARDFSEAASEDDIAACFRLLLGRNPGKKEWHAHRLTAGQPLAEIVTKFLSSNEFKGRKLSGTSLADSGHEVISTQHGFKICISAEDQVCATLRSGGSYEPAVTSVVRRVLAPGSRFVDIGANIGYFSVMAAMLVGEAGRVFAVEPYAYNLKLLTLNLKLNSCANVEILPFALSNERGLLNYDDSAGNSGQVFELGSELAALLDSVLVYAVALDDIMANETPIDLIKMDIEGAEHLALQGMQATVLRDRPIIISEVSEGFLQAVSGVSMETYLKALLLADDWELAVIGDVDKLHFCGRSIESVTQYFHQGQSICMDVVAFPSEKRAMLEGAAK